MSSPVADSCSLREGGQVCIACGQEADVCVHQVTLTVLLFFKSHIACIRFSFPVSPEKIWKVGCFQVGRPPSQTHSRTVPDCFHQLPAVPSESQVE